MTPKKAILRALLEAEGEKGPGELVRPSTIPGFKATPEAYQKTINRLLKDRLIEGTKDPEGHMAISLNTHRIREIRKALRPIWAHPAVLGLLVLLVAVAGMSFLA